jgi:DNA polymerase (family 10)
MNTARTRTECVSLLEELALLLELSDGNPFRVRAVQNGARVLDGLQGDLTELYSSKTLQATRGIGKGMLELIEEYLQNGSIAEVQELRLQVPAGVVSLTSLRGVGAKKAKALHEQLGISGIGELEYACRENRLVELKGFGEKTQASILAAIETWNAAQGKCRLPAAQERASCLRCRASRACRSGAPPLRSGRRSSSGVERMQYGHSSNGVQRHAGG